MVVRFTRFVWIFVLLMMVTPAMAKDRWEKLFDGKTLDGWTLSDKGGRGYIIQNGELVCPSDGGGNLFTKKEYSDFKFRFEFKLTPGANNGIGLRAPVSGDAAYVGMESQVLDDTADVYKNLLPGQYHGSIYRVFAAKRGSLRPVGDWNKETIELVGSKVKVTLNGVVIVEGDIHAVKDPGILAEHPGLLRKAGHIGFLGHGTEVRFRNLEVSDLTKTQVDNVAPAGFTALFNGKDLSGWKGLVGSPLTRAKMTLAERKVAEDKATVEALRHWTVVDGVIAYNGKNDSLATAKDYQNFELHVDFKIGENGDSGIYLRGSPQIQIWDPKYWSNPVTSAKIGSGGLYNNQKNPSQPTSVADKPIGEWNRFVILMVGEKVTIYLNGVLVVHNVTLENYWDRSIPIFQTGQIELQHHGNPIYFKNVFIREIN